MENDNVQQWQIPLTLPNDAPQSYTTNKWIAQELRSQATSQWFTVDKK
eukprot:CAMPEP_0114003028 /NCGR_PEP_ID=MMETSP0372-20130328/1782_1 /TAXON_ID=340204 /ORGANISM="Lankesteria abbotti" /LENGTH=47 /assembly_acc=CAM_ASM_000359